ncbi:MAG: NAD-dependent malic enzyme [Chloroflexi bacterium]|nr:NAD-dependent malic enzyme [Chloroflexota bacterium]
MTNESFQPQARVVDEYESPVSGYQLLMMLRIENAPGKLGLITTAIGESGGDIGAVDIHEAHHDYMVRELRVFCRDVGHAREIVGQVDALEGVDVQRASDRTFQLHRGGKIEIANKVNIRTNAELSHVYTPGVARVSMMVHDEPDSVWALTARRNTVAVVTDGTAVLGLGDIGPEAAMPVMEGKCMLFKSFGEIDAWPICLDTKDPDRIVDIVEAIAPTFGGILLEDISAPRCFDIEDRLVEKLDIPVFHDDQHGTAVVVLAALINSLKIVDKKPEDLKVVVLGVGASGIACARIMLNYGVRDIIGFDRTGAVYPGRENLNPAKEWFAEHTNPDGFSGDLTQAMRGADMFLGLSGPRMLSPEQVDSMAGDSIVLALSNPEPEIMPELITGKARVIATGRSDYPNQVNNVLCFPGLFRGAFDAGAKRITEEMKLVAAHAIAEVIPDDQLNEEYILPSVFNEDVVRKVAAAVAEEARRTGNVREGGSRVFV